MSRSARIGIPALAALLALLIGPSPAPGASSLPASTDVGALSAPDSTAPRDIREGDVKGAVRRVPKVRAVLRRNPGAYLTTKRESARWVVQGFTEQVPRRQIVEAYVDPESGRVLEAWTGFQVAWSMARGYPGAFGKSANSPWIWITLCVLFVLPFLDVRRPLRWLHLDLLVLVGFSVSLAFFNDANLGLSVPIAFPLLLYLVARLTAIGLGRAPRPDRLRLLVPWPWLAGVGLFLIGLRIGLNMVDGNVIDVGYSGVIGADKIAHGRELYGAFPTDNEHGDTYGPLLYLSYVPFEAIWPWQGRWDDLPAAHVAAGAFDLAVVALLFLLGRRLRGTELGVALAYAWCAYPFTLYVTNSGANDALPAALVTAAVLVAGRPAWRGAFVTAAGLSKFVALPLIPLFAAHGLEPGRRIRGLAAFALGALLVAAFAAFVAFGHSDPSAVWDRTIGFQTDRDAPFSMWGFYGGGWRTVQSVFQAALVIFACAVPLLPRRRDLVGLAALAGAILAGVQLATTYWFYTYLVWVAPLALVAFLGRAALAEPVSVPAAAGTAPAPAPARRPFAVTSSG